jgi:NAD(P)-dependent dehydrogenase (short-subunit alcohol dehydrogenase family)
MSVVLITGCSTGIGFATAETLARNGHTVYATMRDPQSSPDLAQLAERDNLPVTILRLDVDTDESVKTTINQVLMLAGQIDVLVNNAGVAPLTVVEETPFEVFQQAMETNFFGTLRCIQAVLPQMRQRRSGLIINISSMTGKLFVPFFSAYGATKAAVEALSESLAGEVGAFGIRVAVVRPGVIDTPVIGKLGQVPAGTHYPNMARLLAHLQAWAAHHVPATVVGELIQEIVAGARTGFRHIAGSGAADLLAWRDSMSDEEWIASAGIDEETWIAGLEQMGMNVRPYLNAQVSSSNR